MALKRPIADTEQFTRHNKSHMPRKRARTASPVEGRSDSSAMTGASVAEASALSSTPEAVAFSQETSHSTANDSDTSMDSSDDSASSIVEDDENDDDEQEEEDEDDNQEQNHGPPMADEIITLGAPKKPRINAGVLSGASDLASRLKAFLPQMQQANSELSEKGAGLSMEDVADGEEHIEMDLGLGVLEQKKANDLDDLLRKQQRADTDDEARVASGGHDGVIEEKSDVLDRLMNMEREIAKANQPVIEEVECHPDRDNASTKTLAQERRDPLPLR